MMSENADPSGFFPEPGALASRPVRLSPGVRTAALTFVFMACLVPVLYAELTVNYGFVLVPLAWMLFTGRVCRLPRLFAIAVAVYTAIFAASFLGQFHLYAFTLRRTVSFLLFLAYFSYGLMPLGRETVRAFKLAVVAIGVLYAVASAATFFSLGGAALSFSAKDLVGDQRFGFVYLVGAWMLYFYQPGSLGRLAAKWAIVAVLLGGVLLTFSRGAIVALIGSALLYVLVHHSRWIMRPTGRGLRGAAGALVLAFVVGILLRIFLPTTFDFFGERLFRLDTTLADVANPEASAGVRVELAKMILRYAGEHPLTGSGYLGVWIMPDTPEGANSAHNQFTDVLFRTGIIGLAIYVYLLARTVSYLHREHPPLCWGLVSTLIFCFFHDIFKESEGAFVLAFYFGLLAQALRRHMPAPRAAPATGTVA